MKKIIMNSEEQKLYLIKSAREELNATFRALKYARSFEEREQINAHIDSLNQWLCENGD